MIFGCSAAAIPFFGRHVRVKGWHAMPGFEQRCLPSVVVQARHSRFVSVHPWGAASSSANVKNIASSLHGRVGSLPVPALLRQVTDMNESGSADSRLSACPVANSRPPDVIERCRDADKTLMLRGRLIPRLNRGHGVGGCSRILPLHALRNYQRRNQQQETARLREHGSGAPATQRQPTLKVRKSGRSRKL
jgi:hypothetical protein